MNAKIVLIPGDGIGPEIVGEAKKVLEHVAARFGHTFSFGYGTHNHAAVMRLYALDNLFQSCPFL